MRWRIRQVSLSRTLEERGREERRERKERKREGVYDDNRIISLLLVDVYDEKHDLLKK